MHHELHLEDADVGACTARTCRHGLHVSETPVKGYESALESLDHLRCRKPAYEEDGIALDLRDVEAALDAAHHGVEQLVEDRPAVIDLGLGHEGRVSRDVGEHKRAFLESSEGGSLLGPARHGPELCSRPTRGQAGQEAAG